MKRFIATLLILTCCISFLPMTTLLAFAREISSDEISIDNGYIQVISKKDGSSFGIETIEGHPNKKYDNLKPLLYDGNDMFATSYSTVRIIKNLGQNNETVNDYIFGSSKGELVSPPKIMQLTSENRSISTSWRVDGVVITQDMILSGNTASEEGGFVNIQYSYINENPYQVYVGIRILLDTKLADNDGGSFFKDGSTTPITRETTFEGDNIPQWYSISDAVSYSTTTAYGLLKNQKMRRTPDKVQMAHWFNLANTMWDYATNSGLDFADYYNDYLTPDSAIAIMFDPEAINSNERLSVDTLYGLGEMSGTEFSQSGIVLNVTQKEEIKANSAKNGYENNGEFTLYLTIDNSDKDSKQVIDGKVKIVFEDKIVDEELTMTQEPAIWVTTEKEEDEIISVGTINRGQIVHNIPIKLKARPVYENETDPSDIRYSPAEGYKLRTGIDVRKISLYLTGDFNAVPSIGSKIVTLPILGNDKPDISFLGIDPKIVYYDGASYFSVQGQGDNFNALTDKSNWTAWLRNVVTNEIINIDSFNCAVDMQNKQLGMLVNMEKRLGLFELTIQMKNNLTGSKTFSNKSDYIESSSDEKYKNRGYSIASIARTNDDREYEMRLFTVDERNPTKTVEMQFEEYKSKVEDDDGEMLMEARGVFKILYRSGFDAEKDTSNKGFVISTDGENTNPNIIGFETIPGSDNIKVNRILYYNGNTPLSFKAEFENNSSVPKLMEITGDGDLSIINASTIWKHKFQIRMPLGARYSYDPADIGNSEKPKLQLLGAGWLIQNLGGFMFDLNYGELGCEDGRYTIDFSGSVAFPLGMSKDDSAEPTNGNTGSGTAPSSTPSPTTPPSGSSTSGGSGTSGSTGSASGTSGSSGSSASSSGGDSAAKKLFKEGNSATNKLGAFGDGGSLGLSVDSVLFGEHEDKDDPEKIKTGFVGVAVTVEIELPKSVFPAGGSQSSDSTVTSGTATANPIPSNAQTVAPGSGATSAAGQQQNTAAAQHNKSSAMSGFKMGVSFNTYDFYAGVDLGIGIGPLKTGFRMSLAEMNNGKICLDSIYFEIKGFAVPIVPGVSNFIGVGGGISDLASSINYNGDARPPVTVYLMAAFDLVTVMALQADLAVSGNGLSFTVSGAPKGFEQIKFIAKGEMDWTTGFTLRLSGTVDLFSGVVLGNVVLGFTTAPKFFFIGKITGSLNIPGLGTLAGITLAVTNEFIAGGARILIFSGGFVYYYSSDNFRLLTGDEVDSLEEIDLGGLDEMVSTPSAGTGRSGRQMSTQFLEVVKTYDDNGTEHYMGIGAGAQVVGSSIKRYVESSNFKLFSSPLSQSFPINLTDEMISGNDIVLRLYYEGNTPPTLTITDPGGQPYDIVEYDYNITQDENNTNGANMLRRERINEKTGEAEKYVYVSIYNDKLKTGEWLVSSDAPLEYTVLTLPSINPTLSIESAQINAEKLDVTWTADSDANVTVSMVPCDENGIVIEQSFTDEGGNLIKNEDPGYIVGFGKGSDSKEFDLEIPSGRYVVRMDSILNTTMFVSKYTTQPLNYVNPKTIQNPVITAVAGGDGRINVESNLPDNATGINFTVYRKTDTGRELLPGIGGYLGDDDGDGKIKTYFKGNVDIKDENGNVKYKSSIDFGDTYEVEAFALNINEASGYFKSKTVVSGAVTVPEPTPPEVIVTVKSAGHSEKTTASGVPYIQCSDPNIIIEYEITNMEHSPNDEVTVRFDIDEKQYGEKVVNNVENGNTGYAMFNITDGEHFVDVVFTNNAGDITLETRKLSVDSIPADVKINSPMQGSTFDPSVGILVDLVTDDGVTIDMYLDGTAVVTGDKVEQSIGVYKKTIPVNDNLISHELLIIATDKNNNKTEYLATVVNKAITTIGGIRIVPSYPAGTKNVELSIVGVDDNGKDLPFAIPKEKVMWTLLSDPSTAALIIEGGNSTVVVVSTADAPFSIRADWNISNEYRYSDVYDEGIVGEKLRTTEQVDIDDGSGGSSSGRAGRSRILLPTDIQDIMEKIKLHLLKDAIVNAYKIYSGIDSTNRQSDNVIYIKGGDIGQENYIIFGTDENRGAYQDSLPDGYRIVSDIVQFATQYDVRSLQLDLKLDTDYNSENTGIYKYSDTLGTWIYFGGLVDKTRKMISLSTHMTGRFAAIENSNASKLAYADMANHWSAIPVYSMTYAGLINGYLENNMRLFKADAQITRGEFIKMLVSAKEIATDSVDVSNFNDYNEMDEWVIPYAAAASKFGWLKGSLTDSGLRANLSEKITRQDAMVLVHRAFFPEGKSKGKLSFSDFHEVAEYALEAISYLTEISVISGYEDGTVRPKSPVLRGETVKILWSCVVE